MVEEAKTEFGLPVAVKNEIPKSMNFGLSLRMKLARFTCLLRSKSVTISQGRLFTPFFNAKAVRFPLLGCISVNRSVPWLNVPRPFCETGVAPVAWTENLYDNPWCHVDSPDRSPDNPINLRAVTCRVHDDILRYNCVERFPSFLWENPLAISLGQSWQGPVRWRLAWKWLVWLIIKYLPLDRYLDQPFLQNQCLTC